MGRIIPDSVTVNSWLPARFRFTIEGHTGLSLLLTNLTGMLAVFSYATQTVGQQQVSYQGSSSLLLSSSLS